MAPRNDDHTETVTDVTADAEDDRNTDPGIDAEDDVRTADPTDAEDDFSTAEPVDAKDDVDTADADDTFPRSYVEKLRAENAKYRQQAADRHELAEALFTARVSALGKLADPSDLPFAEELLHDEDALAAAVDDLIARKPHLARRVPRGDIGQGAAGSGSVSLLGMLAGR